MPDTALLVTIAVTIALILVSAVGLLLLYAKLYVKAEQGTALIVNNIADAHVFFTGALVLPGVHLLERMPIHALALRVERRGRDGLSCRDGIRADIAATFALRVNRTPEDVVRVASQVGAARASDPTVLRELFEGRFIEALASVASTMDFTDLHARRHAFKDRVMELIGEDLYGFVLDDVVLDDLRQTPIEALDPNDILDAAGIKKLTEITAAKRREAATLQAEARRLLIELETAQSDALTKLRQSTGRERTIEDLERELDRRLERLQARAAP